MANYPTLADQPIAGNQYIPESMNFCGKLKPIPPSTGARNGLGTLVGAGFWAFEWRWDCWTRAEMDWWSSLLGFVGNSLYSPELGKRFATVGGMPAARLWSLDMTQVSYRSCVIDVPVWEDFDNNEFFNVMVRFNRLEPSDFE